MIDHTTFIDLDLSLVPTEQGAGLLETDADGLLRLSQVESFEAARPGMMIPRSEWKDRSQRLSKQYRDDITEIYSQGNFGSCVGFASAQMLEVMLRRRYGRQFRVSLSGMSIYKRIGRSPGSGAMVPDGMDAVIEGCLPTDTPENKAKYPHTHPLRDWTSLPSGWQETGKLFRGHRFVVARGADEIFSALLNGFCGIVGRDGHCIPYCLPEFNGNLPVAGYPNSWTANWGDQGWGYDSERTFGSLSCWILLDVATRPDLEIPAV